MIVPESFTQNAKPETLQALQKFPLAFFGAVVKYPRQAEIIRRWLKQLPKATVVTGWKRCCKTASAAWLGSCWLYGGINPAWPGCKVMDITDSYRFDEGWNKGRMMLIGGKTLEHIENILLKQYVDLLPPGFIKKGFNRNQHSISLLNGTRAVIRTYDQSIDLWKSGAYSLIHLDEEPPLEVLNECLERSRTTSGRIIITVAVDDADVSYLPDACVNPMKFFGTDNFIHEKLGVEDVPDEIYPAAEKVIVFNQYDKTPMKEAVRHGEFAYMSGKWWIPFDPAVHVIPPFPIPAEWKRWRSIDAGVTAPSACSWMALHPEHNILFVYREYYKTGTTIDERCRDIIEMSGNERYRDGNIYVERCVREVYENTLLDYHEFHVDEVTGCGLDLEYIKAGLVVCPSTTIGQEGRREIVNKWLWVDQRERHFISHEMGAPRLYIFSNCANLIWEVGKKTCKRATTDRSATPERKVQNKDDHLADTVEQCVSELSWIIEGREII